MTRHRLAIVFVLTLAPILSLARGGEKATKPAPPAPSPALTPAQVVEIQVEALQFNDRPSKDAGIATTFRFASPDNRKVTGPLARFALIVRAPGYRALIDHRIAGFGQMVVEGDVAIRRVTVVAADGQAVEYEFRLSKDLESGCWFTDGVVPIPQEVPVDPGKVALNPHASLVD